MTKAPEIWALVDGNAGNKAQVLGVCNRLGADYIVKEIAYNDLAKLPNFLIGASLRGLTPACRATISGPWPKLVIGAGRRVAPIARYIKKQSGGKTKIVQLIHPGVAGSNDFDLICVPRHDGGKLPTNGMWITASPNNVDLERLAKAKGDFAETFASLPRPLIALIVGGATKNKAFTPEMAKVLGQEASRCATALGGALLVTTSRRTGAVAADLIASIEGPSFIYQWHPDTPASENPYFGFLALADILVVTGDSMSMCSEACATAKPVYIYAPDGMVSSKHARFHQSLYQQGCAKVFTTDISLSGEWTPQTLDPTGEVVAAVHQLMDKG